MLNLLVLEDNAQRLREFKAYYPNARYFETAEGAISELQEEDEWDMVWLDHDLGGETFVDSNREDTGFEVVRWIVENKPAIKNIIVHSWNTDAGESMTRVLKKAGYNVAYIPFGLRGYLGETY